MSLFHVIYYIIIIAIIIIMYIILLVPWHAKLQLQKILYKQTSFLGVGWGGEPAAETVWERKD